MAQNSERPPVIDYEGSDYQETFWERGGRAYEDQVEAVALRRLLPASGELLLEIGAGAGRNTPRYGGYQRIVLLDYSRSQLRLAQERLGRGERYTYVAADAYRLPFAPGQFDAVTMIRTLHHLVEPQQALEQVSQVLPSGGAFILEYANKQNLKAILRYALRRQAWSPFSQEPVEFAALNFDFHPQAMRDWLRASGFEVQRQLTVSHYRLGLLKRWVPIRLLVAMDALAQLTGDWWQLSPSVFVRANKVGREAISPYGRLVFRCPECGQHPLEEGEGYLSCPNCARHWPVEEGVYDFRGKDN
jgi:ubiquinone/menaquinone biosynthesis C-methylase UbiE